MVDADSHQPIDDALGAVRQISQNYLLLPRSEFLKSVAENVRTVLGANVCILWKLDALTRTLAVESTDPEVDAEFKMLRLDSRLRHLAVGRVGYLSNVQRRSRMYEHHNEATARGWVSLLTAPMQAGGHLIGMLDLYTRETRFFGQSERDAFQALADLAATYLWNLDVEPERIIELYDQGRSAPTLHDLSASILKRTVARLHADFGHIRLVDNRTNELLFSAATDWRGDPSPYEYFAPTTKSFGSDVSGRAASELRSIHVRELKDERHFQRLHHQLSEMDSRASERDRYYSAIATERTLGLKANDIVYLIATFQGCQARTIPQISISDCEEVIKRGFATVGLSDDLSVGVAKRLLQFEISLGGQLNRLLKSSLDIFGGNSAHVRLYDRRRNEFVHLDGLGQNSSYYSRRRRKPLGTDVFAQVLRSRKQRITRNLAADPHFQRLVRRYKIECHDDPSIRTTEFDEFIESTKAEMTVPLRSLNNRTVVGCATLTTTDPLLLDATAARDFNRLMNQVSYAIDSAAAECAVSVDDVISVVTTFRRALTDQLANLVHAHSSAAYGFIRLVDHDAKLVHVLASVAPSDEFLPSTVKFRDIPEYKSVIASGMHFETIDLRADPFFRKQIEAHQLHKQQLVRYSEYLHSVRSELVVPLEVERRAIGTATIQSTRASFFSDADRRTFVNSMMYAAVLIQQWQLAERIDRLQLDVKAVQSPHRLLRVLRDLARSAIQLLGADIVAIYEYDQERQTFLPSPVIEGVLIRPAQAERDIRSNWIPSVMVNKRRSYCAADIGDVAKHLEMSPSDASRLKPIGFANRERIRSAAGLVIEMPDEVLGVMFFNFRRAESFPESRRQLLRLFASHAAIAIRNTRLQRSSSGAGKQLRHIGEFNLKRDLNQILDEATQEFDADAGHIRVFDPVAEGLNRIAEIGEASIDTAQVVRRGQPLAGLLFERSGPIIIADVGASEFAGWFSARQQEIRSLACLPLRDSERLAGVLCLSSATKNTFLPQMQRRLEEWCELALDALKRRDEYERSSRNLSKVERLDELKALLNDPHRLNTKLALILKAVTMRGGLEFNRALLFEVSPVDHTLVCRYAVLPNSAEDAEQIYRAWPSVSTLQGLIDRDGLERIAQSVQSDWHPPGQTGPLTVSLDDDSQWLVRSFRMTGGLVGSGGQLDASDVLRCLDADECAVVALRYAESAYGVMYVDNKYTGMPIENDDLPLLRLYAERAALAIDEAKRVEEARLRMTRELQVEEGNRQAARIIAHQLQTPLVSLHHALVEMLSPASPAIDVGAHESALRYVLRMQDVIAHWTAFAAHRRFEIDGTTQQLLGRELLTEIAKTVRVTLASQNAESVKLDVIDQSAELPPTRLYLDLLLCDYENFVRDSLRLNSAKNLRLNVSCGMASAEDIRRVGLVARSSFLKLTYEDNGRGVEASKKNDVFGFEWTSGAGSGVGLAVARINARGHGGAIVETGEPGQGVRFEIYLPCVS